MPRSASQRQGEGEVRVRDVRWEQGAGACSPTKRGLEPLVAAARSAASGLTLAAALEVPAVVELVDGADLLWFDPAELDQL